LALFALTFFVSLAAAGLILLTSRWHRSASYDPLTPNSQKIHVRSVPRIGGLAIFAGFLAASLTYKDFFSGLAMVLLLCAVPTFLAGFQEDLTKQVSVLARLFASLLSGAMAWFFADIQLSAQALGVLDLLLAYPIFSFLITCLTIATVIQGFNLIDGFHGLSGFTAAIVFIAFAYLSNMLHDPLVYGISMTGFAAVLAFLFFNWPFGRLFLGDGGAYLIGYWAAITGVLLIMRHPSVISPFTVVLICWLPIMEVFFSSARRIFSRHQSPVKADRRHLHHLIYHYLTSRLRKKAPEIVQPLVVLAYLPFWGICLGFASWKLDSSTWSFGGIMILSIAYLIAYYILCANFDLGSTELDH